MLNKQFLFMMSFILLIILLNIYSDNCVSKIKVIESLQNNSECNRLDKNSLKTLQENTKNIELLREQINNININKINEDIKDVQTLIEENNDELKNITDQSRQSTNKSINMDVRNDGNVYDEDGNPLYEEK
jgi:GTPase involved in cell partitioning and DNA repair